MKITWHGAASLLIETEKTKILFDPFLSSKYSENQNKLSDFANIEHILITHGHFDHLAAVPLLSKQSECCIYCSSTASQTLEKNSVDADHIVTIFPGNTLFFNDIEIKVLTGKHITFDKKLIGQTLFNKDCLLHFPGLLSTAWKNMHFPGKNEIYHYLVKAEGKTILILGSMALDEATTYPQYVDLLILPYQGCSNPVETALSIIRTISPRTIILDHFDNAFPPVTKSMPTKLLKKALDNEFPGLPVAKPSAGKYITLI